MASELAKAYSGNMLLTFQAYIQAIGSGDAAYSEFVSDAQRDAGLPEVTSWPELKAYLKRRGATRAFVQQAVRAWRRFDQARFLAACGAGPSQATGPNGMRTAMECLAKAAEMNMRGEDCGIPETRSAFLDLETGWRDLARRALRQEKWSEMRGTPQR